MTPTTEGLNRVKELRDLCAKRGLELLERPNGHFQVKGVYLVNYYPLAKTQSIYVAATAGTIANPSPAKAVQIAAGECLDWRVKNRVDRPRRTKGRRLRLWNSGVRACYWCKIRFASFSEATLEHLIPLSKGGLDNPNNYALAHERCNHERKDLLPHR